MRIELPRKSERFGANIFYAPVQAYELDSGLYEDPEADRCTIVSFTHDQIYETLRDMAVVVPVRAERVRLIEGILFAIPAECLVIIVSNSPREPVDRFRVEQLAVNRFARMARKRVILVHQKDPIVARAFAESGYPELLGEDGLIPDGKAEGLLIAMILAELAGSKYVGFVDADNYSPGAAYEYIREYAAGFLLASTPYAMVRILWQSKPKIVEGSLFFARWGRTSRMTNHFLNTLISRYTGFETDVIGTGNAGEHALTLELARHLEYGSGYAVEPQQIISLLEDFGGELPCPSPEVLRAGVDIFQIESRNPHFHQSGPDDHIQDMSRVALGAIHGSPLCPDDLRREIRAELAHLGVIEPDGDLEAPRRYPPLGRVDLDRFRNIVSGQPEILPPPKGRHPPLRSRPPSGKSGRWSQGDRLFRDGERQIKVD